MKITRRRLTGAILGSAAARAFSQTEAPLPTNPDEELKAARDRSRAAGELLAKLIVPMETEPALEFKA